MKIAQPRPASLASFRFIGSKVGALLAPRMYGETGDMTAFLVSHCRLIEASATEPANLQALGSKSLWDEQVQWRRILEEAGD